jgi:hypothetical protein
VLRKTSLSAWLLGIAAFLTVVICLPGCSILAGRDSTLSTSLQDMVSESRVKKGDYLDHIRITTLSGLAPVNTVGTMYHYPNLSLVTAWQNGEITERTLPAAMAVGLARGQSFELVGTISGMVGDKYRSAIVVQSLNEVQAKAKVAAELTIKAALARKAVDERTRAVDEVVGALRRDTEAARTAYRMALESTQDPTKDAIKLEGLKSLMDKAEAEWAANRILRDTDTSLVAARMVASDLGAELATAESALLRAERHYRDNLSMSEGVIVANWSAEIDQRRRGQVGGIASGQDTLDKNQQGFAVLSGLRISMLHCGADFKAMYFKLKPEESRLVTLSRVATYLLQTQRMEYVARLDLSREISRSLELSADQIADPSRILTDIDKVRLESYYKIVQNLGNSGTPTAFKWEIRDIDFKNSWDERLWLSQRLDGQYVDCSGEVCKIKEGAATSDWITVDSVLTSLGDVARAWQRIAEQRSGLALPLVPAEAWTHDLAVVDSLNNTIAKLNGRLKDDGSFSLASSAADSLARLARTMKRALTALSDRRLTEPQRRQVAAAFERAKQATISMVYEYDRVWEDAQVVTASNVVKQPSDPNTGLPARNVSAGWSTRSLFDLEAALTASTDLADHAWTDVIGAISLISSSDTQ